MIFYNENKSKKVNLNLPFNLDSFSFDSMGDCSSIVGEHLLSWWWSFVSQLSLVYHRGFWLPLSSLNGFPSGPESFSASCHCLREMSCHRSLAYDSSVHSKWMVSILLPGCSHLYLPEALTTVSLSLLSINYSFVDILVFRNCSVVDIDWTIQRSECFRSQWEMSSTPVLLTPWKISC